MKLTTILILTICLHASAKGRAQNMITFSGKEVSLESVFNAIKKQTTYRFFFNSDMLQRASKISIDVKNAPLEQVMFLALKDQPLTYTIKGRTIFIMKKAEEPKTVQAAPVTGDPITVSGRVTDDKGQPLVGANVKVKGGDKGVVTDGQGRFTLNGVDPEATLEVSFVGYEKELLSVKGKTMFSVALGQRESILDQTVVIAYGRTTKRFATGNIASVKASDIEKQPVNNPLLALEGRVPGLFITQSTGLPGAGVTVRIQGQNSLRSNASDPLIVIDGIPYPSQMLPTLSDILGKSGNNSAGAGSPLSFIDPVNIESIDVLKDADATAIYGSRAANGAILITTKMGKAGQSKVDIKAQRGWGTLIKKLDLLNTDQYVAMRKEAFKNDNLMLPSIISMPSNDDYDINGAWDTTKFTDWQEELIGNTADYQDLRVSLSGGNANTQFLVTAGYHKETTVFPGDLFNRKGSIHFSLNNSSANQKFKFNLSNSYMIDDNNLQFQDLTRLAMRLEPNAPEIYNEDGTLNWQQLPNGNSTWVNPLSNLYQRYNNRTNNFIGNAVIGYAISQGVELKGNLGYTSLQSNEIRVNPMIGQAPEQRIGFTRYSTFGDASITSWNVEPQVSYQKNIFGGKIDALVGFTIQQVNSKRKAFNASGYNNDQVLEDIKSASAVTVISTINSTYKYNALFGRLNYNLLNKYIVNFTARRDGSSRFGPKSQFHNFWSLGGAWIFSSENFVKKMPFISFGKLRASYGTTGSDQIGDYQFLNQYLPVSANPPYQNAIGFLPNRLTNPYLEWEETKKLQGGVEIGILSDKVLVNVNFYNNKSSNQLISAQLPFTAGFPSITRNFNAVVQNTGYECSLWSMIIKKSNYSWSANINVTVAKNKLLEFDDFEKSGYTGSYSVGAPITLKKAYQFLGVGSSSGIYMFSDGNGGSTTRPDTNRLVTQNVLINTSPTLYGGLQNSFMYKSFQFDVFFQFVKQRGLNYNYGSNPGSRGNEPRSTLARWQKSDDNAHIQKYNSTSSLYTYISNVVNSDASYSDASYVRLKNLSISWQIPSRLIKKTFFQSCRLFTQGQNLLTITNYKGLDPETLSSFTLPPLRVVTIGVQVSI